MGDRKHKGREVTISSALGAIEILESARRGTGRTERVLQTMKNGDFIIVHDGMYGKHLVRVAKEKYNKDIGFSVATSPETIIDSRIPAPPCDVWIDHFVVHKMMVRELEGLERFLLREIRPSPITPLEEHTIMRGEAKHMDY